MNHKDLKIYIADMLQRDVESFVYGDKDALAMAVTNGMRSLQRQHSFELAKTFCFLNLKPGKNYKIGEVVDEIDDTPMEVKKWSLAYWVADDGSETPIRQVGREYLFNHELQRQEMGNPQFTCPMMVVRYGKTFRLHNAPSELSNEQTLKIRFDVVRWLPDLVGANDSNFITEVGPDVLLYHAMAELNLFLKEDERVGLSQSFYTARLKTLTEWDKDQFAAVQQDILLD